MKYLAMLRPAQWLKNLMIYFPPFLGGTILTPGVWRVGLVPFAAFCLAASFTYLVNDICDRENDLHHPVKKSRPIPSGAVPVRAAAVISLVLLGSALWLAEGVSVTFLLLLAGYLVVSVSYSLRLKEIPVLDLFCISSGFLFRLEAGGVAFGITVSQWLFLCVFLLSLFLSTGKRLGELNALGENAGQHRKSLSSYPDGFLELALSLTGAAVLVTYTMYVVSRPALVYTVVLCCFGLLRFMLRVKAGMGGDPTESLLKDRQLLGVSLLWACAFFWIVYR